MLLGVSMGAGFLGFCLALSGVKQWSLQQLLLGHWGVGPGEGTAANLAPAPTVTNSGQGGPVYPSSGNPNTQPYSPNGGFTSA